MNTIEGVRRQLWRTYQKCSNHCLEGKSGEASVCIYYPPFWDIESEDDFLRPTTIEVYSYALGPSRRHYFELGKKESHPNYYTWISPDPYKKAIEVIQQWEKSFLEDAEMYDESERTI